MNYFDFHVGDWVKATRHLSFAEEGAYLRLVLRYYEDERPLPVELAKVQRLVGARTRDEKAAVETVLEEFFTLESDGFHHRRCDEELSAYFTFVEKQGTKARAGAAARWSRKSMAVDARRASSGDASGIARASESDANGMPGACPDDALPTSHFPLPTSQPETETPTASEGGKGKARKASPKTTIPTDFTLTPDLAEYAQQRLPDVDPSALFDSFRGKAEAKGWTYANWRAAFQEYVRNCAPNSGHWAAGQYPRRVNGQGAIQWQ